MLSTNEKESKIFTHTRMSASRTTVTRRGPLTGMVVAVA